MSDPTPPNLEPGIEALAPPTPPLAEEPPPPQPERYPFWGYSDLLLFAGLAIPCMFIGGTVGWLVAKTLLSLFHIHRFVPALQPLVVQGFGYVALFASLALILRLQYDRPFWASLGWTETRLPFLWIVISGMACAFGVALLGSLIHTPTTNNPVTELLKDRTSAMLMAFFGTTIAPLAEELVFRGFIQPLLARSLGPVFGIILSALPFGLLHYHEYGDSWRHAVLISLAGACFGWMRQSTGSTRAATLMHASYNAVIFYAVFAHQ